MRTSHKWLVAALSCGFSGVAFAQAPSTSSGPAYPAKPIRIIVPYSPGGTTDILTRAVGQKLTAAWGQQVIVDHRPGASGQLLVKERHRNDN